MKHKNKKMDIDIFNLEDNSELEQKPQYSTKQFISGAKEILMQIESAYCQAWENRCPTDEEYEMLDLLGCDGSGAYEIDGEEIICVTTNEGDWMIRTLNSELFTAEVETTLWNDDNPFFELIHCDITNEETT